VVQLIVNLLENAPKYTPPGTTITLSARSNGKVLTLLVQDDGPGFGIRDPESMFGKFQRGREESEITGLGLGLAICRVISQLHGGAIRASNRVPHGACFEVDFSLQSADASTPAAETRVWTQAMHLVLIVEDDPAISGILRMLFELNHCRVVTADTCERALREVQSHRPDICLVDLGLPDRDGLQFIEKTRLWSPVPIIVLNGPNAGGPAPGSLRSWRR